MGWFDDVTGTNDYERQSWRDNYNGGRAAGDITGNVNARLEQERSDYQGATWSGSSKEYSAIELAQRLSTPAQQAELRGAAGGAPTAAIAATYTGVPDAPSGVVQRAATKGQLVKAILAGGSAGGGFDLFGNAPAYKPMDLALSGGDWQANPYVSNAEDAETRHGDLVGSLYGAYSVMADLGWNASRAYFGNNHDKMTLGSKFGIMGNHASQVVSDGAVGAVFGGFDAVKNWAAENKRRENAGAAAAAEFDDAWDARQSEYFYEDARGKMREGLAF